jgi:uncharacterized protein YcgI (DUF1989 family)
MKIVYEHVIPPKRGHRFTMKKWQILRVTDLEGRQVVDMALLFTG